MDGPHVGRGLPRLKELTQVHYPRSARRQRLSLCAALIRRAAGVTWRPFLLCGAFPPSGAPLMRTYVRRMRRVCALSRRPQGRPAAGYVAARFFWAANASAWAS